MRLYGYRNGRTLRALWALEEVGAEYEFVEVDVTKGEGQTEWFLKINPFGKVPVLVAGDLVISESAAICQHVAQTHPAAALLPPPATAESAHCHQWISFLLTEVDAPLWTIAKHRFALPVEKRVPAVVDTALWELQRALRLLDDALRGREFLVGDRLTVADIVAGHCLVWAKSARIAVEGARLASYGQELGNRPAMVRAGERARSGAGQRAG
jgi:glutathione S-transferase